MMMLMSVPSVKTASGLILVDLVRTEERAKISSNRYRSSRLESAGPSACPPGYHSGASKAYGSSIGTVTEKGSALCVATLMLMLSMPGAVATREITTFADCTSGSFKT